MLEDLKKFCETVHNNFWAGLILGLGIMLVILRHEDAGKMLLGGGLAHMQIGSKPIT